MAEELSERVARLESERAELDARVLERQLKREAQLAQQRARLERAESREEAAHQALASSRLAAQALEVRRNSAFARAKELSGKVWMHRQTALVGCFAAIGAASWPVLAMWGACPMVLLQLGLFAFALLVIPRRK